MPRGVVMGKSTPPSFTQEEELKIYSKVQEYLHRLGFMDVRHGMPNFLSGTDGTPDIVVIEPPQSEVPYIVVEIKRSIPKHVDILNPSVQRALSYAKTIGSIVQFILITNGEQFFWFEIEKTTGLLSSRLTPPRPVKISSDIDAIKGTFITISDFEWFQKLLWQTADILRSDLNVIDTLIVISEILVAKIYDEDEVLKLRKPRFISIGQSPLL